MAYPDTKKCTFYKLKDREKRKIEQKQTEAVKNLVFECTGNFRTTIDGGA